jgi:hypothetical protein
VVLVDRPTELANDVICNSPYLRRYLVPMTRRLVLPVYSPSHIRPKLPKSWYLSLLARDGRLEYNVGILHFALRLFAMR